MSNTKKDKESRIQAFTRYAAPYLARVEVGQVWGIPSKTAPGVVHRLMCGSATDRGDVRQLLAGYDPELLVTDGPYSAGGVTDADRAGGTHGTIMCDNLSTRGFRALYQKALETVRPEAAYMWHDWRMHGDLRDVMEVAGLAARGLIVWDKGSPATGHVWRTQHELVLFGSTGPSPLRPGLAGVANVLAAAGGQLPDEVLRAIIVEAAALHAEGLDVDAVLGRVRDLLAELQGAFMLKHRRRPNVLHFTEKPVEVIGQLLDADAKGPRGNCPSVDIFAGAGGHGVACEERGRQFYHMELTPLFTAVELQRFESLGLQPQLLETGR